MSDVSFKDTKGVWHVYHEKACKRCGEKGTVHGSVARLDKQPQFVAEGQAPTGEVFPISGGVYVGLHVCADCAVILYGAAKIKNI